MPWIEPALEAKLAALEGLISAEVGVCLADLAASVPPGLAIVEIGAYLGKSTAYLATGSVLGRGAPVFSLDPWNLAGNAGGRFGFNAPDVLKRYLAQLESVGLLERVTPIRTFARDMARHWVRRIGLLYVDGSHTKADVREDWDLWSPFLVRGAVVAFDDCGTERNPGVAEVIATIPPTRVGGWTFVPAPLAIGRVL